MLVPALVFIALVVAAVGSLGAPLITSVATAFGVSLASAQWTLTITLLSGAVATPLLGRLGAGPRRRGVIIATLGIVTGGSVLTVLPLPFAWLLLGRAAQGVGLGLTALMMGVARDHLPGDRAPGVITLVSVASTIGIGVGYPLAGLLAEAGGLRAAYGLGVFVTAIALLAAVRSMPAAPAGRSARVDVPGAALLAAGLLAVLLAVSETGLWRSHLGVAVALTAAGVLLLGLWAGYESRAPAPLVDPRLLRHKAVAGANIAMLVGGAGMYLLLTLITRYAQTPRAAGYGFGLTTFEAGLVLVPFSVLGFVAGKVTPRASSRFGASAVLALSAIVVLAAFWVFALARANVAEVLAAMAILGFGVGGFSAAMPRGHPVGHPAERDIERDERQPGCARRRVLARQRARRPGARGRHPGRPPVPRGRRLHGRGLDRRRRHGRLGRDQPRRHPKACPTDSTSGRQIDAGQVVPS
jgi:predicted MFS family arabinose efflux permease